MVEASELKRLAYLQAMGVDSYVSRESLPAAAVSRRLRVVAKAPMLAPEKLLGGSLGVDSGSLRAHNPSTGPMDRDMVPPRGRHLVSQRTLEPQNLMSKTFSMQI